jgi:hypothetical protein
MGTALAVFRSSPRDTTGLGSSAATDRAPRLSLVEI